ncbi:hypothetical protein JHK82_027367 [Glycine max]|uniref:Uncharacterized protein n=1 Tax=Glycine soja TaxID=3848 RepID=A0A0B2PDV4_GLYSO|nr:hypothetical protein JHK87_027267 [Glycine soja]KAG4996574.1 hypothetical protein JHK85_028013 [Glycine max]KAG5003353.1 hypothetical protein JHK86_027492 [Glycine max]KAG5126532.1 hypothetical protein JHK82_027367 [Glycine max]KAG5151138.1 hypothetical protein JHK84_027610 [Glycine max]
MREKKHRGSSFLPLCLEGRIIEVGVSLQGRNTLTRYWWCHLSESDNVKLLIV